MANEEIIAVFKADIEQFKTQMAELGVKIGGVQSQIDGTTASTEKFAGKTKSASGSISVLSRGLGGVTGLLGITGRLIGVNTEKLEALIFSSQQFASVARKVADAQKLMSASSAAAIPILGAVIGVVTALAAIFIRYQDQLFGVTEAQKEKTKADDGAIITDEKLRASYNESIKTIQDLGIEYRLITGQISEYDATLERLRNNNKDAVEQIKKDTKIRTDEIVGFWASVKLAAAQAVGLGSLEQQKILDDLSSAISDRNNLIGQKGKELTKQEELELAIRFKQIDEDTKKLLKANQDRIDKEKEQRKKAAAEALKELREFQNDRNEINAQAAEDNLVFIRKTAEAAREELENQQKKDDESSKKEAKAFFDFHDKEDKRLLDEQKKRDQERIDAAKQVVDTIFAAQQEAFDKRQALLDKEITAQDANIEHQRRLAEQGLENTLAFEEKRSAELQRQQQLEAQKQKRVKLLETFLNSLAEYSKTDPNTALQKALLQVALAQAASAIFAEEGGIIGEIGERSNLSRRHKGGGDVLLHAQTGEGILSRREMDNLGKRNFHLLKDAARFPIRDDVFAMPKMVAMGGVQPSNADVVKELKALQHIVKNKRESHFEVDKFGSYIKTSIENGVTEVTKGKLKRPRFNG